MAGRVALVTGGIRGIGAAIASMLKSNGYRVAANYHGLDEPAKAFNAKTGIPIYKWDVSDFDACQKGALQVAADLGPIEVLVNNAGITRDTVMHKMTKEMWNDVINVNLNSVFNMSRAVIESMRTKGFGRIVSISSINGQAGQFGQTNYSASKAGIIGFSKALAQESAAKGITVNVVAPGYTDTEMVRAIAPEIVEKIVAKIPVGRLGKVEEIAKAVCYLAGDDAGYITGSTISINGGQYFA
ncbi:MAG TPA: acetoacetyl-CoA reductase [Alphaproteobacteria bacterium]|nr:acetoacetyl-CoA reductase [Alphaproteobacteria bacterium]